MMLRTLTLCALGFALAACSGPEEEARADAMAGKPSKPLEIKELPEGAYRLQKAQVIDSQGFGQPMVAYRVFIPAGWQSQGGIVWQQGQQSCGKAQTRVEWVAYSPDGYSAVEILPEEGWSGHNLPNMGIQQQCPNVTITTIKDYLQWWVQRNRPGARILDYRDRPDFTEKAQYLNKSERTVGGELSSWAQGGEVLIAYESQGRDMRETVAISVLFMLNRMAGVMPGEVREFLTLVSFPGFAARAPHGELDFKLTETVRKSIQGDPQWQALMAEHNNKMSGIAAKGAADRHKIRMDTIREIGEMNQRSFEDRMASSDRIHHDTIQTIRGVDTYVDPQTRQPVELPYTHGNVWRLDDDTFILTDDSNFQPYRDLGVEGRQMELAN